MRRFVTLLLAAPLLTTGCTEPPKPEPAKDLDKIKPGDGRTKVEVTDLPSGPVAVVSGVEIPNEKFREVYDLKVKKYTERGRDIPATADRRYRKSIIDRLIWNEVLVQEVKKLEIEYDPDKLKKREEQQRRGIRDWDKHLERRGETEESLRSIYVSELREEAILDKLGKLAVTDAEVAEDYEKIRGNWKAEKPRVRASHILVPISPRRNRPEPGAQREKQEAKGDAAAKRAGGDDAKKGTPTDEEREKLAAEAKTKIDEIYALVQKPDADFAAIAAEHSTGPSAQKGGDIGIFTQDRMAEEFAEVAFAMKAGEVSEPVRTKFGWHIIKVTGAWPPGELPLEALDDQIRERLEQRKLHQGRRQLKEDLLATYEIVDNIKPTLGPDPRKSRKAKTIKPRDGHGGDDNKPDPARRKLPPNASQAKVKADGGDAKADGGDVKADDGDAKGGDAKAAGDAKGGDAKGGDAKGGDAKGGDAKGGDAKGGDAKGAGAKGGDAKGGDAKGGDAKGGDAKAAGDAKGGDAKGGDAKGEPAK